MPSPDPTYLVRDFPGVPSGEAVFADPVLVQDVEASFASLRERGDYLGAQDGDKIPEHRYTGDNYGPARALIHFQGVQRLRDGKHFVVSGGDKLQDVSHLFLLRVGSASEGRWFGSNLRDSRDPPEADTVVNILGLRNTHWHAGGISLLGDVIAVALEAGERIGPDGQEPPARIAFLDLHEPLAPRSFSKASEIVCPTSKAGAVALTNLPNRHFLCGVWRDAQKPEKSGRLDLFLSATAGAFSGFASPLSCRPWTYPHPPGKARENPRYQSVGFLREAGGLYFVGTGNTNSAAPAIPGSDYADLFRVELPESMLRNPPEEPVGGFPAPVFTWINSRKLNGADEYCNMAAGGGMHVSPAGILSAYGAFHWRISGAIRLSEFRADCGPLPDAANAWVDLFEHEGLRGRRLSVIGVQDGAIPDYTRISVQGRAFDDSVSAARYQLPVGRTYRLFKDKSYRESGNNRDYIDLAGTGAIEAITRLAEIKKSFGDCVSSSRFV